MHYDGPRARIAGRRGSRPAGGQLGLASSRLLRVQADWLLPNAFVGYAEGMATKRTPHLADAADWMPAERTAFLISSYGGVTKLAGALGVTKSQPSRWRSGQERPSAETALRLLDLDHVLSRAVLVWAPGVAVTWLESANGFLDGARPIDVLMSKGVADVIAALDATASGAFA